MHPDDLIAALSTCPGSGSRAVVRLSGPGAWGACRGVVPELPTARPAQSIYSTRDLRLTGVHASLPARLYFALGPRTATGQDVAEFHLISSPPLVDRLLADLIAAGARQALPGEFTLRAFLAGKKDLTQAEAVLAVIHAGSEKDLKQALQQLAGNVAEPLHAVRDDLLNLLADVEAGLDFVEEDISFVDAEQLLTRLAAAMAQLVNVQRKLDARSRHERPIRVVLSGPPNVGKSSLFNALLGCDAAIVSAVAGTTRDYLKGAFTLDGVAVELIDTAGDEFGRDDIETEAQRLRAEQLHDADLVLDCRPAGTPHGRHDRGLQVSTMADLQAAASGTIPTSTLQPNGLDALRISLTEAVAALARPPLAAGHARCRGHLDAALIALRRAHEHVREDDPQELLALALRESLQQLGELTGTIHTNDLLDRIFSRFCIGK